MSVRENLALGSGRRYRKGARLDWRALEAGMAASFQALAFPVPPLDPPIAALSGGNLQRVVIAREMAHAAPADRRALPHPRAGRAAAPPRCAPCCCGPGTAAPACC